MMEQIGPGQGLSFPRTCKLLADSIYSQRHPLVTTYSAGIKTSTHPVAHRE